MDYSDILKALRKKPLAEPEQFTSALAYDQTAIKKIIPHRNPFLLLDQLQGVNLEQGLLRAFRKIAAADPVFAGHFPGSPVYPGSLQLEMIGQAGLCLYYFLSHQASRIAEQAQPVKVRATKILGALFLEPLEPGAEAVILIKKLSSDAYLGSVVGQVLSGKTICTVAACEVCFLE